MPTRREVCEVGLLAGVTRGLGETEERVYRGETKKRRGKITLQSLISHLRPQSSI